MPMAAGVMGYTGDYNEAPARTKYEIQDKHEI